MKDITEGMIAVTGCMRSGTSMVMQTLKLLGIPMSAPAFIKENEHVKQFNPNGYYELNLAGGIYDDRFKGKAVKLFGGQLHRTPKYLLSRLIFIVRDRQAAIESYDGMRSLMPEIDATTEQIYDANDWHIRNYMLGMPFQPWCISYEQVIQDPEKFVDDLILYLRITPSSSERMSAIENIKK